MSSDKSKIPKSKDIFYAPSERPLNWKVPRPILIIAADTSSSIADHWIFTGIVGASSEKKDQIATGKAIPVKPSEILREINDKGLKELTYFMPRLISTYNYPDLGNKIGRISDDHYEQIMTEFVKYIDFGDIIK